MASRNANSVDTVILAKACAMVLMVANHSTLAHILFDFSSLSGGLNAMIVISGISMATHAFQHDTKSTLRAFLRSGLRLAIPCLGAGIVLGSIRLIHTSHDITIYEFLTQLTLLSNWLHMKQIIPFPIWYIQAVIQMLAGLAFIFMLTDLTPRMLKSPIKVCGLFLIGSATLALISYSVWDTSHLGDRLPHQLLWQFVLGWLVWAMQKELGWTLHSRVSLTAILLASAVLLFVLTNVNDDLSRALWMVLILLPVIWARRVPLPRPLVHIVHLLAQAVFAIFLLHMFVFSLVEKPLLYLGFDQPVLIAGTKLMAGLIVPVLLWAASAALIRVWRLKHVPTV